MTRRVLMVHERFLPDSGGGGEYVALRRAQGLIAAGYDVQVICAGDPGLTEHEGVPTRRLRLHRRAMALAVPALARAARTADLIHAFPYNALGPATLAAKITRTPLVVEHLALFGSSWRDSHPGIKGKLLQAAEARQLRWPADARIFLSQFSLDLAHHIVPGLQAHIVTPGLDPSPELSGITRHNHVVFAGQLSIRKGLDRLADVARALPDVAFRAVGWIEGSLPCALPENVTVVEATGAAYRRELASARVAFVPSRAETFGIVLYEAMQAGCAVVSTIPGPYEGRVLAPWSVQTAVEDIRSRLDDPARADAEGQTNKARADALTWGASTQAITDIYDAVLMRRQKMETR